MRPLLLMMAAALAGAAEIVLVDGTVLEGEIQPSDEGEIALRIGDGPLSAVRHLTRDQVARVRPGPGPVERRRAPLLGRAAQLARSGGADDWWRLVCDARQAGDDALARTWAGEVLARDRQHRLAREFLGFSSINGVWMRAYEIAVAHGLVLRNGRWMTWAEREQERTRSAESARRRNEAAADAERLRADRQIRAARAAVAESEPWPLGATIIGPTTRVLWWPQTPCQPLADRGGTRLGLGGRHGGWWWRLSWND